MYLNMKFILNKTQNFVLINFIHLTFLISLRLNYLTIDFKNDKNYFT